MTSTNGHKTTDLLKTSDDPHLRAMGDELSHMILTGEFNQRWHATRDHRRQSRVGDPSRKRPFLQVFHLTDNGQSTRTQQNHPRLLTQSTICAATVQVLRLTQNGTPVWSRYPHE